jgi:putative ABC transport system permease protein
LRAMDIVIRNLSRRKGRLIFSSSGLIFATALMVSATVISYSMQNQVGKEVEKYGANIVVTPSSRSLEVPYGTIFLGKTTIPEKDIEKIFTIPNRRNIRVVSPKLYGQIELVNYTLIIAGILPTNESMLKVWWNVMGSLPHGDADEILLGSAVEELLKMDIGSTVHIGGTALKIVGILGETGSVDDYTLFIPLHVAQKLLGQPAVVSVIDVGALCNECPVETIAEQIQNVIPDVKATPVKQAVEIKMRAVEQIGDFSLVLSAIVLAIGCAGIMNAMLSSVHERTREIGVLMSLGADNSNLYRIFLFESTIIGLLGAAIGCALGLISAWIIGSAIMKLEVDLMGIPATPIILYYIASVASCIVVGLYPARIASRIDPVQALRSL